MGTAAKVGAEQQKSQGAVCLKYQAGIPLSMLEVLCICILGLELGGKLIKNSGLRPLGSPDVQHRILYLVM